MKKIFIAQLLLILSCNNLASAKSAANYNIESTSSEKTLPEPTNHDLNIDKPKNTTINANYQKTIDFNDDESGLYLAPSVDYQRSVTTTQISPLAGNKPLTQSAVNSNYGIKVNFGYERDGKISPYITTGMLYNANNVYNANNRIIDPINELLRSNKAGYFYGVGTSKSVNKDLSVGVEYNTQNLNNPNAASQGNLKSRNDVYKLNAKYNF